MKCPDCQAEMLDAHKEREFLGVTYNAPVEKCPSCGLIASGPRAAFAELEAVRAANHPQWDEQMEKHYQRLRAKFG